MNTTGPPPLCALAALALTLSAASPAVAQSTTLVVLRPEVTTARCPYVQCPIGPAELVEIDVEGARFTSRHTVPFDRGDSPQMVATADGRYLVWLGNDAQTYPPVNLTFVDRATGAAGVLLSQAQPTGGTFSRDYRILAHPTELRVLAGLYQSPTIAVDAFGVRGLEVGGERQTLQGITADGSVALISRETGPALPVAVRVDTGAGTVLGQFPVGQFARLAISPDGRSVYSATAAYYPGPPGAPPVFMERYTRHDAVTGVPLAAVEIPGSALPRSLTVDPRTGRLYALLGNGRYRVLAPLTLAELGTVTTPVPPLIPLEPYSGEGVESRLVFDPHHPRAFLLATRGLRPDRGQRGVTRIDIVDTDTLALVGGADLGMEVGPVDLAVVPRPSRPTTLTAEVTGSSVTLRWTPGSGPGLATAYRVEAGSAPGLANLATLATGPSPTLVVDHVPPGTYHVRVRAANWGGASAASPEISITVP